MYDKLVGTIVRSRERLQSLPGQFERVSFVRWGVFTPTGFMKRHAVAPTLAAGGQWSVVSGHWLVVSVKAVFQLRVQQAGCTISLCN